MTIPKLFTSNVNHTYDNINLVVNARRAQSKHGLVPSLDGRDVSTLSTADGSEKQYRIVVARHRAPINSRLIYSTSTYIKLLLAAFYSHRLSIPTCHHAAVAMGHWVSPSSHRATSGLAIPPH